MRTIRWVIERLDNGITLEDIDACNKEAALFNNGDNDDIFRLLGQWLYSELIYFQQEQDSLKTNITINLDDDD